MGYVISKSKYCKGIQCPKILWMDENKPECASDTLSESVLKTGTMVGELARSYFGSFSTVEFNLDKSIMVNRTRVLIEAGVENIAEAAFLYDSLYCAVDILHKNGDGWDIVEVKSSTEISESILMIWLFSIMYYRLWILILKKFITCI